MRMMKNSLWYASYAETGHKEIDWLKEYILLPLSVAILIRCAGNIEFSLLTVLFVIVGIAIMMMNLKIAHILMHRFNGTR